MDADGHKGTNQITDFLFCFVLGIISLPSFLLFFKECLIYDDIYNHQAWLANIYKNNTDVK